MKLKNSFRMQFAFVFVALMASCILISILVSNLLLKAYSRSRQMNYLESSFEEINDTLGGLKVILPSEMKLELDRISSNNNYAICLFDEEGNIAVYSSEIIPGFFLALGTIEPRNDMIYSCCRCIRSLLDSSSLVSLRRT